MRRRAAASRKSSAMRCPSSGLRPVICATIAPQRAAQRMPPHAPDPEARAPRHVVHGLRPLVRDHVPHLRFQHRLAGADHGRLAPIARQPLDDAQAARAVPILEPRAGDGLDAGVLRQRDRIDQLFPTGQRRQVRARRLCYAQRWQIASVMASANMR
jgi:hypothetical protein